MKNVELLGFYQRGFHCSKFVGTLKLLKCIFRKHLFKKISLFTTTVDWFYKTRGCKPFIVNFSLSTGRRKHGRRRIQSFNKGKQGDCIQTAFLF